VIVDNLSTGKTEYVNPQARFIEADITNKEAIQAIVQEERPEIINHHAAHIQVGYSVKNPQFDAENNILGLLHIMEAAKEVGVKRVLMASTGGAMYGNKPTPFDESMEALPLSPYGVSKRSGELYLHYYYEQYGISYTALRYSNVYGPRQNPHGESGVVAIFSELMAAGTIPTINGDGTHTRDYVYVSDVAQANVLALTSSYVGALNIGTGIEVSTNEVFDKVSQSLGLQVEKVYGPERPGEQVASSLSAAKAKEVLGWEPTVSFDEGVKQVSQWYQNGS
jgi:UDP-glucose 4-epimerase